LLVWALPEKVENFVREAAKFSAQFHCTRITQKYYYFVRILTGTELEGQCLFYTALKGLTQL